MWRDPPDRQNATVWGTSGALEMIADERCCNLTSSRISPANQPFIGFHCAEEHAPHFQRLGDVTAEILCNAVIRRMHITTGRDYHA